MGNQRVIITIIIKNIKLSNTGKAVIKRETYYRATNFELNTRYALC